MGGGGGFSNDPAEPVPLHYVLFRSQKIANNAAVSTASGHSLQTACDVSCLLLESAAGMFFSGSQLFSK